MADILTATKEEMLDAIAKREAEIKQAEARIRELQLIILEARNEILDLIVTGVDTSGN